MVFFELKFSPIAHTSLVLYPQRLDLFTLIFMSHSDIPLSLYIHFPWCVQKCPYCDFNSHAIKNSGVPEDLYINRLIADFEADLPLALDRPLQSIFMGGGTPSLFSHKAISKLLKHIESRLKFSNSIEITLEANPGTIERGKFQTYFDIGINRISLGVQSFNPKHLKKLGRIHSDLEACRSIEEIYQAGFKTFNLDIMHGLPDQTPIESQEDLKQALSFAPPHLSWYQLTLEPNTLFHAKPPSLPSDETLGLIEDQGFEQLKSAGLDRYEISAYSKPGHESLHNKNYWEFGDYLGIGAGAHGKISDPINKIILRTNKKKHPKEYLDLSQSFLQESREIPNSERPFEFLLNTLRLINGVDQNLFESRTFLPLSTISKNLKISREQGLIELNKLAATPLGLRYLNSVLESFI